MMGKLEIIIILFGFIGFPLILWLICFWVDHSDDYVVRAFVAGYFNTTAAITAIQFKTASGNIDAGTFKLYGVS